MRVSINELASAMAERKRDWTNGARRKKGRGDEPPPPLALSLYSDKIFLAALRYA